MILQMDDWAFDVDIAKTMAYSASEAAEHCTCAYCRNFYATVDSACPGLRQFLAQYGVDVEAPEEMYPIYIGNQFVRYSLAYVVYGRIIKATQTRKELIPAHIDYSVKVSDDAEDHFILELHEIGLPWVLDEPVENVVSPVNETSFL